MMREKRFVNSTEDSKIEQELAKFYETGRHPYDLFCSVSFNHLDSEFTLFSVTFVACHSLHKYSTDKFVYS